MEHTVEAYLGRLSTEELENFLQNYLESRQNEDFSDAIGAVVSELAQRKKAEQQK